MELEYESKRPLYIPYAGPILLEFPLLNKGSAFSEEERSNFNLHGLLPEAVETIEEQTERAYRQYQDFKTDNDKHIYLRNIQDTNETLFYRMLDAHLSEMMPIIYTPTVGEACEHFSDIYRRARGLFISYPNRDRIDDMLQNATKQNVKVIVPLYMGWRHPRISGDEYYAFVDEFIQAVKRRWPNVLLQFEDFAQKNATPLLNRYRDELCCFNDDIQGTAAVTLGSLIAASRAAGSQLRDQTITFLGAGSAGCGIAEQIIAQMKSEGLSDEEARQRVFMVDRFGLLTDKLPNLLEFQSKLVQKSTSLANWEVESDAISLLEVVRNAKPTVLIGVSGQPGLFTEEIIREMHSHCARPIVMPLSNPTSRVEARPEDIINWTDGAALVATGSPFGPVSYKDQVFPIAQCNNSYIFPGIGLGVLASGAKRVTDGMLMAASRALADCSPLAQQGSGALLPDVKDIQQVSRSIAFQVGKEAQLQGVAVLTSDEALLQAIDNNFWQPLYRIYKRTSF